MLSLPNVVPACRFALQDVNVKGHSKSLVEPMGFEPTTFPVSPGHAEQLFSLVEPMGFEPTTSSMPSRRAPNCATAPPGVEMLKNCSILAACGQTRNMARRCATRPFANSRKGGPPAIRRFLFFGYGSGSMLRTWIVSVLESSVPVTFTLRPANPSASSCLSNR
jgi:hypothetical protein